MYTKAGTGEASRILLLPFQKNNFASNLFAIPILPEAKACLCQAGLGTASQSQTLRIDNQTGPPIRLIESS
jgi:hypothetical protein